MQNSTFEVFKKDEKRVSGKCGGILFVLKLILGLFPVLQRRGAFLALFACSFLPLYADEFVVSTLADDGNEGSLRSGIIAANGSSAIDTITFAQGVSGTITLTSDLPAITENLTITGPSGSESVTISGNDQYAMFSVSGKTLTLSDLTFTEIKSVSGENGSIITLASANAVATGITVTGNTNGTAFFSKQSTLTISDSTFSDNSGLIFGSDHGSSPNQSSVPSGDLPEPGQNRITVTDSLFKLNSGTIFSTQRYVKIDGCVFSENSGMIGSFSGLSPYQVLDSEFNGNTNSLLFAFYTPHLDTHGGFFNGNHHLFDGNTFSGNTGNLINVGNTPRFGEITTISNNTFEGSGGSYTTYITGAAPIYLNNVETPLIGPGADLTNANLIGADLTYADLTGADLTGADLTGADLTNAYLTCAYLTGADLTGADLTYADLTNANLNEGANLTNAILAWADLTGAYLT
ncbi:pentapeptide repeat-containing protein, partial [Akkermansiaceae bacterium]|nr:pentapeptide repeat-containing protein [Akkermansiaceae bacterium]